MSGYKPRPGKGKWDDPKNIAKAFGCLPKETITLRDQFAMAALTGILACSKTVGMIGCNAFEHIISKEAYQAADAMLRQRQEKTNDSADN